jgi:Flp pilus assembly protein TadB
MNMNKEQTMTNKLKAAGFVVLYTLAVISGCVILRLLLDLINPTLEQVGVAVAVLLLAFAMKMMYAMRLGQLDSKDRLNEITKTNPTLK